MTKLKTALNYNTQKGKVNFSENRLTGKKEKVEWRKARPDFLSIRVFF